MFEGIFQEMRNAFNRKDNVLAQLIIINVVVFVVLNIIKVISFFGPKFLIEYSYLYLSMPSNPVSFIWKPWTVLTYGFTHLDFFHILFNMLGLYWFGRIIQDLIGSSKVLSLYVLGVICGGLAYLIIFNSLDYYHHVSSSSTLIGASAAVFAVVAAAATLAPDYSLHLLFLGPVRIKWIALVYIFLSFIGITEENAGGNLAHLGGALIGIIYIKQLRNGRDLGSGIHKFIYWCSNIFKPKPKIKVTYKKTDSSKPTSKDEVNQAEIDAILDKISLSGYSSLTTEEKQKLFSASQKKN